VDTVGSTVSIDATMSADATVTVSGATLLTVLDSGDSGEAADPEIVVGGAECTVTGTPSDTDVDCTLADAAAVSCSNGYTWVVVKDPVTAVSSVLKNIICGKCNSGFESHVSVCCVHVCDIMCALHMQVILLPSCLRLHRQPGKLRQATTQS
jgi:hypothetical protein